MAQMTDEVYDAPANAPSSMKVRVRGVLGDESCDAGAEFDGGEAAPAEDRDRSCIFASTEASDRLVVTEAGHVAR
jgi:hypothetical protein